MANVLSLEERMIGFFLQQTDNVTSYGDAAREKVIPFLSEGDYTRLRQVRDGLSLENSPAKPYVGLVKRNPFLGLEAEQAMLFMKH